MLCFIFNIGFEKVILIICADFLSYRTFFLSLFISILFCSFSHIEKRIKWCEEIFHPALLLLLCL